MLVQVETTGTTSPVVADNSLLLQLDTQSGELLSEKVRTVRGPDGAARTYKTVERLHNGEII